MIMIAWKTVEICEISTGKVVSVRKFLNEWDAKEHAVRVTRSLENRDRVVRIVLRVEPA